MAKLLRTTNFPSNYSADINLSRINIPVMSQWIERKITEVLGFDDEIVASTAINLFLPTTDPAFDAPVVPPKVDPKRAQLNLAGFLGEEVAATFCRELWTLLVDAQTSPTGIPHKLLEETKQEMASRQRPRSNPTVMNPMVREASRRAEAARQALAAIPPRPVVSHNPVPVSPPHPSEQPPTPLARHPSPAQDPAQRKRDDESPRQERKNPPSRRERHSRRDDSDDESSSSYSSSSSASSFDGEEERRRRRRERERLRRYEEDEARRRRGSRDHRDRDEDEYGRRRRREEVDRPRYREEERRRHSRGRDRHSRGHRDHSREPSYERDDRRRRHRGSRGGRRSRSYSDSS
jgi:serine/arginine repetitive matrix protein 1